MVRGSAFAYMRGSKIYRFFIYTYYPMRTRLNDSVREQGSAFVVKFAMAEDIEI